MYTNNFVNRQIEINKIKQLAIRSDSQLALFIEAEGGIGKTKLIDHVPVILSEIKDKNFWIPEVIDFDDKLLLVEWNLEFRLLKLMRKEKAAPILSLLVELWRMQGVNDSPESITKQKEWVFSAIAQALSNRKKRLVLRFDTMEKVDFETGTRLVNIAGKLDNVVCIFSGRPLDPKNKNSFNLVDPIERKYGKNVHFIKLLPFSKKVSIEFLNHQQKKLGINLGTKLTRIISVLANGRPILMDLAIDYVIREIDLSPILSLSRSKLSQFSRKKKITTYKNFESKLVKRITELREPLDRLVLVMSRVYPVTKEMISELLGISIEKSEALFLEAKKYLFVKTLPGGKEISLHDEMRRLIVTHVWESLDPDNFRRRRDSIIAQNIFDKHGKQLRLKIKQLDIKLSRKRDYDTEYQINLQKQRRDIATEKWLEHSLYVDLERAFSDLRRIILVVRDIPKDEFIQRLIRLLDPYVKENNLDAEQLYTYKYFLGYSYFRLGPLDTAEKIFQQLKGENRRSPDKLRGILNMFSSIRTKQGRWRDALRFALQSRKLVKGGDFVNIARMENLIGFIYRNLEDYDKRNLDKSIRHYKQSLDAARKAEPNLDHDGRKGNHDLISSINTNLGYAYGLKQEYELAYLYCLDAINLSTDEGNQKRAASAESALAIIERDQGKYEESINLFNSAINKAKLSDDKETLCRIYFHFGWTMWFKAEREEPANLEMLEKSASLLEESKRISEERAIFRELPGICHQLASVYWRIGRLSNDKDKSKTARALNDQSYMLSKKFENIHYVVDSLVGMAEFDLDESNSVNIKRYIKLLNPYKQFGFALHFGRMERIKADFAFQDKNLKTAFRKYAIGLSQINQHGGYGPYSIERELKSLADKIQILNLGEARRRLTYLRNYWQNDPGAKKHANLIVWSDQQLMALDLRSMRKQGR